MAKKVWTVKTTWLDYSGHEGGGVQSGAIPFGKEQKAADHATSLMADRLDHAAIRELIEEGDEEVRDEVKSYLDAIAAKNVWHTMLAFNRLMEITEDKEQYKIDIEISELG